MLIKSWSGLPGGGREATASAERSCGVNGLSCCPGVAEDDIDAGPDGSELDDADAVAVVAVVVVVVAAAADPGGVVDNDPLDGIDRPELADLFPRRPFALGFRK